MENIVQYDSYHVRCNILDLILSQIKIEIQDFQPFDILSLQLVQNKFSIN